MRVKFDEQLQQLHEELLNLGALCENAISLAAKALEGADKGMAGTVFEFVNRIEQKGKDVEALCMRLLLRQQPVAGDLRVISAALKMVTDMERIGVNSGDIAEIISMGHITPAHDKLNIHDMALAAIKMVTDSINAFVKGDTEAARLVLAYDDVVDSHFDRIKTEIISRLAASAADGEYALDLLMTAKYFERMADHASEIANWVIFSITGKKADPKRGL